MFLWSLYQQKLPKLLSKNFKRSIYWNKYKTKSENKNAANEYRYFLKSNFVGVNRLFVLLYSNENDKAKRFKTRRYYLPKKIDSDIKRYGEIRKLTIEKGEHYATGCLLDYDYTRTYYRSIAVDLSRQKESNANPKAIGIQMEFVGQLKKTKC